MVLEGYEEHKRRTENTFLFLFAYGEASPNICYGNRRASHRPLPSEFMICSLCHCSLTLLVVCGSRKPSFRCPPCPEDARLSDTTYALFFFVGSDSCSVGGREGEERGFDRLSGSKGWSIHSIFTTLPRQTWAMKSLCCLQNSLPSRDVFLVPLLFQPSCPL